MDAINQKILAALQQDAAMPVADIAARAGISASPCWRRIQALTEAGIIRARVALLDARKMNVAVSVFVQIRTNQHSMAWADRLCAVIAARASWPRCFSPPPDRDRYFPVGAITISLPPRFVREIGPRLVTSVNTCFGSGRALKLG